MKVKFTYKCPKCGCGTYGTARCQGDELWRYCANCFCFYELVEGVEIEKNQKI